MLQRRRLATAGLGAASSATGPIDLALPLISALGYRPQLLFPSSFCFLLWKPLPGYGVSKSGCLGEQTNGSRRHHQLPRRGRSAEGIAAERYELLSGQQLRGVYDTDDERG
jgi:hypothetical protein